MMKINFIIFTKSQINSIIQLLCYQQILQKTYTLPFTENIFKSSDVFQIGCLHFFQTLQKIFSDDILQIPKAFSPKSTFQCPDLQQINKNFSKIMQSLRKYQKPARISIPLQTIGELVEITQQKKQKSKNLEENLSPRFAKVQSPKLNSGINIFDTPNKVIVNQAVNNPFLLKKLQLTMKSQLKRQEQNQNPKKTHITKYSSPQTTLRMSYKQCQMSNSQKLSELKQFLKIES